ncbi:MAG: T9SS type A sorting domain-containing protein [Candidatus Cyclobacteriaceae bacterium M3_2C_046]
MRSLLLSLAFSITFAHSYSQSTETWSFEYPGDEFTDEALLDLQYLNENEAGENGFIELSADGNAFVDGNGQEIRFWAINGASMSKELDDDQLATYARFLAKMGVNMIRFHGGIHPRTANSLDQPDQNEVDAIWRAVAAMKKEGIYSVISPFWAGKVDEMYASWGIDGYVGEVKPWGVMYFNEKLKNAYKSWTEYLYTETNPYTGIPLKDDPAVAIIQVKNEDGLFFWTVDGIKPEQMVKIQEQYYQWLVDKYGSIEQVQTAWQNAAADGDDLSNQQMALYITWELTQPQSGGKEVRVNDQVEFLAEVQRNFYQEIYDHYRSLGCKQLINGNNWKTADPTRLFDAERWTNAVFEVMAVNRYYSPNHSGTNSGWRIDPGHQYEGNSVLMQPHQLPINIKQVDGHPFMVTESAWNLPHKYQTEGPFLIAAYMSLTGVDGYFWFAPNHQNYHDFPYFEWTNLEGGQKAMHRWTISTPGQIGMFPANALLYRKNYLTQGNPVIKEVRQLEAILDREIPLISEENSFDPNRDTYDNTDPSDTEYSPLSYLAGPVQASYDGLGSSEIAGNLSELVNFSEKTIQSTTDQLVWDYETGICTMDAPKAQGVTGFLSREEMITLTDVKVISKNEYATVNVVAMDDQPINQSKQVMIQVGTIYRPTGWRETPSTFEHRDETVEGFTINNTGTMPWKGNAVDMTIKIKNNLLNKAKVLDAAGYPVGERIVTRQGEELSIQLPKDAMYVILQEGEVTGLEGSINQNFLKVYPNPTRSKIRVDWQQAENRMTKLEVLNARGQVIYQQDDLGFKNKTEVKLPPGEKGLIMIRLQNEAHQTISRKVLID